MITSIIRDQEEILDLIIDDQQIVAIFQGKGEWGPRALGNRSILFDPRHPQTVTEEQNKNYYNLIKGFYERTEVPMIFNTSFNLGGEALVETIHDAIDTCNRSEINYLYIPEDQEFAIPLESLKIKDLQDPSED